MASKVKSILKSFQSSSWSTTPEPTGYAGPNSRHPSVTETSITVGAGLAPPSMPAEAPAVLIELFQSQGCNSCPPTNDNLINFVRQHQDQSTPSSQSRYYAQQSWPSPSPPLSSGAAPVYLLLTYQVTYWNYLGWDDTFSLPANDIRQREYVRTMGLRASYTPMVVVNGRGVGVGNTKSDLDRILRQGTADSGHSTARVAVRKVLSEVDISEVHVEVDATGTSRPGPSYLNSTQLQQLEIWEITYTPTSQDVHISRGENAGRTLPHLNVVKDVKRIGYLEHGAKRRYRIGAVSGGHRRYSGMSMEGRAIIVQDGKGGQVLGFLKV
jgi:hypothetical protein